MLEDPEQSKLIFFLKKIKKFRKIFFRKNIFVFSENLSNGPGTAWILIKKNWTGHLWTFMPIQSRFWSVKISAPKTAKHILILSWDLK